MFFGLREGRTGYIGNVLCGAMFLDTGQTGAMLPGVPSTDQTGGINAPGMVNAQAFNATGAGAGTEILNSGSALGFCPSSSASCIPSTGAFFQQPGSPITGSWGISWPTGLPTSVPGDTYFGPLLFSQVVSSTNASTLSFSVLTDPNNNTLATASSASHAFTNGDLASISLSSTGADFVDSTIAVSNVVTSAASLASNQAVNGSGSQGQATGFTNTAGTVTSGDLAAYTASGQVGNCTSLPCNPIIGVFNSSTPPTWIASGETAVNLDATVNVAYNDILCASATVAGTAHDNGSIACTTGEWVGIVKTTAPGVTFAIAFVALR